MRIPEAFKGKAILLQDIGVNDVAWLRTDALELLKMAEGTNIAVLGGDVLEKNDGIYSYNYDNWSSDLNKGEQWPEYAARSRREARDYLKKYPDPGNGHYVYCLVFAEKPTADQLIMMYER